MLQLATLLLLRGFSASLKGSAELAVTETKTDYKVRASYFKVFEDWEVFIADSGRLRTHLDGVYEVVKSVECNGVTRDIDENEFRIEKSKFTLSKASEILRSLCSNQSTSSAASTQSPVSTKVSPSPLVIKDAKIWQSSTNDKILSCCTGSYDGLLETSLRKLFSHRKMCSGDELKFQMNPTRNLYWIRKKLKNEFLGSMISVRVPDNTKSLWSEIITKQSFTSEELLEYCNQSVTTVSNDPILNIILT
jgi:hypothetical protein